MRRGWASGRPAEFEFAVPAQGSTRARVAPVTRTKPAAGAGGGCDHPGTGAGEGEGEGDGRFRDGPPDVGSGVPHWCSTAFLGKSKPPGSSIALQDTRSLSRILDFPTPGGRFNPSTRTGAGAGGGFPGRVRVRVSTFGAPSPSPFSPLCCPANRDRAGRVFLELQKRDRRLRPLSESSSRPL